MRCLRLPRLAGLDVEIGDVVRGLVAMRVLADEAGDIRRRVGGQRGALVEKLVELREEGLRGRRTAR